MADSERGGIHVVLLPYPSQGHINPILQFGKRLAGHGGVRCTLAVTRFILRQGEPSTGAVHVAAYSDGYDAGGFGEASSADEYLARLESHGSDTVDRLLCSEAEQGRPVHALVYDSFLSWAPRVAARHGAASASFFTQACAVNVAYENVFSGRVKLPLAAGEEPLQLPGISVGLTLDDVPTFMADTKDSPAYLDLLVNQFKGLDKADHVLVNSFYELQPQEADHMASTWRSKTVGPTVPSAYLDNRLPDDTSYGFHLFSPATETKAWLDTRPPRSVAYVSFGSVATPSPSQMAEVAEGLYNTDKPFLWVVRASETSKIPEGFAAKAAAEERGLIVTWCPQLEVLAHPAVGCFVTHCGWNSTTEGLSAGVPMVAVPQWSDQTVNAKYIKDVWRVGVRVRPDGERVVRKEELERCIREVMEGERSKEFMKNANGWKEKARNAMCEGGSSDKNIIEFIAKIGVAVGVRPPRPGSMVNITGFNSEDSDGTVHVLLLSYPAQGHVNPLLQFGKRLAAHRGVRCTLAVTRSLLNSCCRAPPSPSGGGAVHVAAYSDGCDARGYDELGDEGAYLSRLESSGSATLDDLLRVESGEGRPVHVVVYDAFLPWATRVARRHGASCAAFFTQACVVNVAYAHAWAGRMELPLPTSTPAPPLPGVPPELEPAEFPTFLTASVAGRSAYLDLLLQQCQGLEVADHVLVNSFHELQPKEAEYMAATWGAKTIGPTVPSAYLDNRLPDDASYGFNLHTPMAAESNAWLDERAASSVVYVSFGSLATPSAAQMSELAYGLRDSGRFFLWVVRSSETDKLPDGFAFATASGGKVAAAEGRGLIVPWCPQLEVLAHGAVGCFVTHCGWNSTVEAVSAGVPMVAVAQWSDQPTNARYVEDVWRVGVRARPDGEGVVRKEEVERCVAAVMDGERSKKFMTNAASWSAMARRAMSQGGSSDTNISDFLSKICSK
uniref:Deoxynivalenol-UDP-glucosyltransferase n=1 Tax=Oryza punctata TaxID=4537 RepID=A0A0E0M3G7_ORYPU